MPMTPIPVSASFTSSSLKGLMIASTFFMVPPEPHVGATCMPPSKREKSGSYLESDWSIAYGTSNTSRRARISSALRSLGDAVLAHLRIERRAAEAEHGGGGLLVPARGLERLDDRGALDLLERARGDVGRRHARLHLAVVLLERLRKVRDRDRAGARDEDGPLERVLELAHVARPR